MTSYEGQLRGDGMRIATGCRRFAAIETVDLLRHLPKSGGAT